MKYQIEVRETLSRVIEIEAEDEQEAVSQVEGDYRLGNIVLDADDFTDVDIAPLDFSGRYRFR